MRKIKIYHAFNGFLYAPIFLAKKLGLFPESTELKREATDKAAIEALVADNCLDGPTFAICDPFSIPNLGRKSGDHDRLCVVGSLIDVLPLWVYDADDTAMPLSTEEELGQQYHGRTKSIICYEEGTTGHLIGERLATKLKLQTARTIVRNGRGVGFGEEFDEPREPSALVVTADALWLANFEIERNRSNIVFNYANYAPLKPFFFTGILTLKSTVDKRLWAVLAVLGAIREALAHLKDPSESGINYLVDIYSQTEYGDVFRKLKITDRQQQAAVVKKALHNLFRQEVYKLGLAPEEAGWEKARNAWKEQYDRDAAEVSSQRDPIPSLLINPQWRTELEQHFRNVIPLPPLPDKPQVVDAPQFDERLRQLIVDWLGKTAFDFGIRGAQVVSLAALLMLVVCTIWVTSPFTGQKANAVITVAIVLVFALQYGMYVWFRSRFNKGGDFTTPFGIWAGAFASVILAVATALSVK